MGKPIAPCRILESAAATGHSRTKYKSSVAPLS